MSLLNPDYCLLSGGQLFLPLVSCVLKGHKKLDFCSLLLKWSKINSAERITKNISFCNGFRDDCKITFTKKKKKKKKKWAKPHM